MFNFFKEIFTKNDKVPKARGFNVEAFKDTMSGKYGMTYRELHEYWDNIDDYDISTIHKEDYNNLARNARLRAKQVIKDRKLDDALLLLEKEKFYSIKYCKSLSDCTTRLQIYYEHRAHEDLANILRLQKKHIDALLNYTYFVTDNENLTVKYKLKKLKAYFNRAKLTHITFDEYKEFILSMNGIPDFSRIETAIKRKQSN